MNSLKIILKTKIFILSTWFFKIVPQNKQFILFDLLKFERYNFYWFCV